MRAHLRIGSMVAALVLGGSVIALAIPTAANATPAQHGPPGNRPGKPFLPRGNQPVPAGTIEVAVTQSPEGPVLVEDTSAASGQGLYVFSGDAFPLPEPPLNCTASNVSSSGIACTTPWTPLLVASGDSLVAGPGVQQNELSTVSRNGGEQVTYFGHPLYGFVRDSATDELAGEDIAAFNGVFLLVSPNGVPDPGVATVGTEVSKAGVVLSITTASGGRTLYMLSYDTPGPTRGGLGQGQGNPDRAGPATTTCTGACTAIWPPLLTSGRPIAGLGVDPRLIGELRRPDGTTQVTYAGWPVYLYAFDLAAGAPAGLTNGEYLLDKEADGVWYTVAPQGGPDPGTAAFTTESASISGSSPETVLAVTSAAMPAVNPSATVYTFSLDTTPGTSACTGTCAKYWPPVLTSTPPSLSGLSGAFGTIQRSDGSFQVTYNGQPLYFFSQDLTARSYVVPTTAFGGTFTAVTAVSP